MKIQVCLFLAVGFLAIAGCTPGGYDDASKKEVSGFAPVYSSNPAALKQITALPPQPTVSGGKLYVTGTILYQVEQDSGIHVINYSNPSNPQKISFIKSFLCKEVSVKNGYVYTNNMTDLVVIDASNPSTAKEVGRTVNVFSDILVQYPAKTNNSTTIYFECPDPKRGPIIAWKEQKLINPKCSR